MANEWIRVYTFEDPIQGELANAFLHEQGIDSRLINRKDSAFLMLGQVEIHTRAEDAERARSLIEEFQTEEEAE